MCEHDLTEALTRFDRPVDVPDGVSDLVWQRLQRELRVGSNTPSRRRWHRAHPLGRAVFSFVAAAAGTAALVGVAAWIGLLPWAESDVASTTESTASPPASPPWTTPVETYEGELVAESLRSAQSVWMDSSLRRGGEYAFWLTIECDCPDAGSRWVRVFAHEGWDGGRWNIDRVFDYLVGDVGQEPVAVETQVADPDGYPVYYRSVHDERSFEMSISHMHAIDVSSSVLDGEWEVTAATSNGESLPLSPDTPITFRAGSGALTVTADGCPVSTYRFDAYESALGLGPRMSFFIGCPDGSDLLASVQPIKDALDTVDAFERADDELTLTGPSVRIELEATPS